TIRMAILSKKLNEKREFWMKKIALFFLFVLFAVPLYAENAVEDAVVARVNETTLTMKDLEAGVDRLIPQMTFHKSVPEEKRKRYYKQALDDLIDRELIYQRAAAEGIKPDKEQVDAALQQYRKRFRTEEGFKADLERKGLTEEKLRSEVEKDYVVQALVTKSVIEPSMMSEEALKEYYEKNTSKFKQPESVKLKLVSAKDEAKAKEMLSKLKAGEDFGAVAYEMSEDSFRVKGGDIGYMHKGRVLPEIEDVAFKIKVGELSDLIKAGEIWYIIKVEDKKPERQMTFEEVKDRLKKDLEAKREKELKDKLNADLRAKAKIEVLLKAE
ncbi:MAG: peptidyl-prolyl cis-trans isomerase, partial [Nitrospirota bacterium]